MRFKAVLPLFTLLLFFLLWECVVRITHISKESFPAPSDCLSALKDAKLYQVSDSQYNDKPALMAVFHFAKSIARVGIALFAVALVAIPVAVLLEASLLFRFSFTPLFSALASVTPIVWTLLAIRMRVLDDEYARPAFVILAASMFLMSMSIHEQFHAVPNSLRNLGSRLGATRWKHWWRIIFPASAPQLLHLFRLQFLFGLAIVPFVELSGTQYGVGQLVHRAKQGSNISLAFGLIILLAATGYSVDLIFRWIHTKFFRWQIASQQTAS